MKMWKKRAGCETENEHQCRTRNGLRLLRMTGMRSQWAFTMGGVRVDDNSKCSGDARQEGPGVHQFLTGWVVPLQISSTPTSQFGRLQALALVIGHGGTPYMG